MLQESALYCVIICWSFWAIASMEWGGKMRLWNLQGQELTSFSTHKAPVVAIQFSPDGKMIATAEIVASLCRDR
ncbi:WD40 repeat domain-containing protein [Fischerella thermalis]|uniref:WD40 repeat domain-containing protein n=1 Tax=Fischerella thermalis TaxID=372787 RepID=UPI0015E13AFE|nr:hypothetical protein [Fischerella thermalis]